MVLGPLALAGIHVRLYVAPAYRNPQYCLSATARTAERKPTLIDGSARKGFLRNLFDVAANRDAATVEYYKVGHQPRDSDLPTICKQEHYR